MSQLLYALPLLACPVGMGAMMWFMMRGGKKPASEQPSDQAATLTRLQAEIDQLRATQRDADAQEARPSEPKHL
ncbi:MULTISPECIES: hypothetical protein [Streptomyces]|uniref:hypothetical protein n=1 Tax=Streptomyces TaxID=1883 RepID=UPI0018DFAF95|nr:MULTISPECIES: hypothetical protein [Streptomyces]MCZ4102793.1 hypothetical protein [Streptomyces sp. H39-C1]